MSLTPEHFLNIVKQPKQKQKQTRIKFAKIDPNYTSGRPKVIYDEDIINNSLSKQLPYLAAYTPKANDRVMVVQGVIIGKIV